MRKILLSILAFLMLTAFLNQNANAQDQPARIQIIHNSADPAVALVDIYVNDLETPLLADVPFRGATGFLELDASLSYDITVTPAGADPAAGFSFEGVTFEAGENYYVVATGVADPGAFSANPDGIATGFFLDVVAGAKLAADDAGNVEFIAYHGATDAPAVDVIARGVATLESDFAYTDASENYIAVPADAYVLDINVAGTDITAASFDADLSGLGGGTAIVLASGFLSPADNQNGPGFGLIAVLVDGTVVELPAETVEPARIQIIHNSADPAVALVDIYVNDLETPLLADVPFRGATGFLELDATLSYDITVTPAGADPAAGFSFEGVTFEAGENYYVVATGVADPGAFAANPDGIATGFFLDVVAGAKLAADDAGNVEFIAYHGATDAPAVDVIARGVATLESGFAYTDASENYIAVPADAYVLDINVAGTDITAASFDADLSGLGGGTAIVLASGFLSPADNQNGPGFGLIAVLVDGTVVELAVRTSTENPDNGIPAKFELGNNYPNPFNPTTQITYSLPEAADVRLDIYSINGQRVATLVNTRQNAGSFSVTFDATNLASGVYLYRLSAGTFSSVQKMTLIK